MARHGTLEAPPEGDAAPQAPEPRREAPVPRKPSARPLHRTELFSEALLDMSPTRPQNRTLDVTASLVIHLALLTVVVLLPLIYTEALDLKAFTQTMLVAPPPPPPPPPPPSPVVVRVAPTPKRFLTAAGKLWAPSAIPEKVAMIKEEPLPPEVNPGGGVPGGVPGGIPGGQQGGVLGGILSGLPQSNPAALPIPPRPAPRAPVRVGGLVKPPRPLSTPQPIYPTLARQARIQGEVIIDAVIDASGNVVEMQVLSGPPLLVPAALEALARWKYEPTLLNGEPIAVRMHVTVSFRLG